MFSKILSLIILRAVAAQRDCDPMQTDVCGEQLWPFFQDTTKTPANEAELKELCNKTIYAGTECTKDFFKRCPKELKKTFSDPLLESFITTTEDLCTGNLGKRFLPHGDCLKTKLHHNYPCVDEVVGTLESVALYEPSSERLKLMCCTYLSLGDCLRTSVSRACGIRAARNVLGILQSYAIFLVDKCLPVLSKPKSCDLTVLKRFTTDRKPRTLLPALIDVIEVAFE